MISLPKILIVDDQPVNIKLLEYKLEREGMSVHVAYNGNEALKIIPELEPDLILLDIMMPEVDGMEVCRLLREKEETRDMPVIFITARSTKEGKIAGFKAGADDYITKPIDLDETFARIKTQLRIRENHRSNLDLQNRLMEMRQAATVGAITQGIAHNLNNLLGVVIGYLDLTKSHYNHPDKVLRSCTLMDQALKRMTRIVHQITTLSHNESLRLVHLPIEQLLENAVERFELDYGVNPPITIFNNTGQITLLSNAEAFEDALGRILMNAYESYPTNTPAEDRVITITVDFGSASIVSGAIKRVVICVEDEGRGLDPEIEPHAFEPFVSGDTAVGKGLGLTIARHHIRRLGGDIQLEKREEKGTRAKITHPFTPEVKVEQPSKP